MTIDYHENIFIMFPFVAFVLMYPFRIIILVVTEIRNQLPISERNLMWARRISSSVKSAPNSL